MARPGNKMINVHYIMALRDEDLYSQAMVLQNALKSGLFSPDDEVQKARSRLSYFVKTRDFPRDPDGFVVDESGMRQPAWYGARWKSQVPRSYLEDQQYQALRQRLAVLTQSGERNALPAVSENGGDLVKDELKGFVEATEARMAKMERLIEAMAYHRSPSPRMRAPKWLKKLGRVVGKRRWAAISAALLIGLSAVYALQWGWQDAWETTRTEPIAILTCGNGEYGLLTAQAIEVSLKNIDSLRFISLATLERSPHYIDTCDGVEEQALNALAGDIGARMVLWGKIEEDQNAFVFRGGLYHVEFGSRPIFLTADLPMRLAEAVGEYCLRAISIEERPLPVFSFYSDNSAANVIFSEAEYLYEKGYINSSRLLYERAGVVYDPSFYAARAKLGRAQFFNGMNPDAMATFEQLFLEASGVMPYEIEMFAGRHLAAVYYENARYDKLEALLARMRAEVRADDSRNHFFFVGMEAKLAFASGQSERAEVLSGEMWSLAEQLGASELAEASRTRGQLLFERRQYSEALDALEVGLTLARDQDLLAEEADLLSKKAEVLLRMNDPVLVDRLIKDLSDVKKVVEKMGRAIDAVRLEYWLGRAHYFQGEGEVAVSFLESAARTAEELGVVDLEIGAKMILARQRVEEKRTVDALRLVEPLLARVDSFPPKYAMWIYDRLRTTYFEQGEFDKALDAIDNHLLMAQTLGDKRTIARSLNSKGYVLLTVGRHEQAEQALVRALELYEPDDQVKVFMFRNLVRVYEALGESQAAKNVKEELARIETFGSAPDD